MTYAWRTPGSDDAWTEISGPVTLPAALEQNDGQGGSILVDWTVSPAFLANPPAGLDLAALGFAEIEETDPPSGMKVVGSELGFGAPPVRTWLTESYVDGEVAGFRDRVIAAIKAEAQRRIYAVMALHEQLNAMARGQELQVTYGADPIGWPEADRAVLAETLAKWEQIKAIRAASDAIEAAVPEDDVGAILAFAVADNEAWPVPPT